MKITIVLGGSQLLPLTDMIYEAKRTEEGCAGGSNGRTTSCTHLLFLAFHLKLSYTRCLLSFTLSPSPIAAWNMLPSDAIIQHFWDQFEPLRQ